MSLLKGYHLYTEIWDDQPPLVTFIVTKILQWITPSVAGPRLLTVLFSAGLLAAFFLMVRRVNGLMAATVGTLMLMGSPGFLELASSCMQENLVLAPVMASLCVLAYRGRSLSGIVAAALIFGFALQMKLIAAMYLPVAALIICLQQCTSIMAKQSRYNDGGNLPSPSLEERVRERRSFMSILSWRRTGPAPARKTAMATCLFGAIVAVIFLLFNLLTGNPLLLQLQQALAAHFSAAQSFEYGSPSDHSFEWAAIARNWDTVVPALVGIALLGRTILRKRAQTSSLGSPNQRLSSNNPLIQKSAAWAVLPLAWLALTFVVFPLHQPWWTFYYVHNSIPLCWCAAIGAAAAASWAIRKTTLTASFVKTTLEDRPALSMNRRPKVLECGSPLPLSSAVPRPKRQRTAALQDAGANPAWAIVALVCGLVLAGWMGARVFLEIRDIRAGQRIESCMVLKEIGRYKPYTKFLFAFDPIYSFHAGIPMPPHLAMISLKRLWSGEMTNERLAAEVERTKPELILLPNNGNAVSYQALIEREYKLVYHDERNRLFAHRDISKKPYQAR